VLSEEVAHGPGGVNVVVSGPRSDMMSLVVVAAAGGGGMGKGTINKNAEKFV